MSRLKKKREEHEENGLDDQHQEQVAGELADVDRRLVARRQEEALPAVVLALDDERSAEPEETAQDEPEPEQAGEGAGQALAVGP